jgi:succinate dehydrogenase/fumarate reductase-like Fe-S protein
MSLHKKTYAYLLLALQAVVHYLRLLVRAVLRGGLPRGIALYNRNYLPDGLVPLAAGEVERLPAYERCAVCGLCDAACPLVPDAAAQVFPGPSFLASCLSRSLPQFHAAADYLAYFDRCGECRACEEVCPEDLPLREIAAFVRRKIDEIRVVGR